MGSALFLAAIMTAFVLPDHGEPEQDAQQGCKWGTSHVYLAGLRTEALLGDKFFYRYDLRFSRR
jgi:hypothetical protein